MPSCPDGGRRGVQLNRLGKDVLKWELRKLLLHGLHVVFKGRYENMRFRHDVSKAVVGLLQQRSASSEEINKLFRLRFAAHGPQSSSDASRQNDAVVVLLVFHDNNVD